MEKLEDAHLDNYSQLLPIFIYNDKNNVSAISSEMDRSIKKAEKLISTHSITVKPELDDNREINEKKRDFYNQNEYNKWVDDAYLLMAKSYFYKHEFDKSRETFQYILSNFNEGQPRIESKIWLARIAIIRGKLKEAENTLIELNENETLEKNLIPEYEATMASLEVEKLAASYGEDYFTFSEESKQLTQSEKIEQHLLRALESTSSRFYKQRYNFILAQLYQQSDDSFLASKYYRTVIKLNPPYEMTFNAKINMALSYESGAGSRKENEKQLNKMLRDDKNIEYQDQIYYALGNLYFKENEVEQALDYYMLSASTSVGNVRQQARTYLTVADIFYNRPEYIPAQAYYDSAVGVIDEGYPGYNLIYAKSISLTNLVANIQTVELQDSVQKLSYLSEPELMAFITDLIEEERIREQEQKELERQRALNEAFNTQQQYELQTTSAGWYYYNPTAVNLGRQEFRKDWGTRKLEDDWRRSNKSSVEFGTEFTDGTGVEGDEYSTGEGKQLTGNKYSHQYYLIDIPRTDSAMVASHKQIETALVNIGDIYYHELKDYQKATEAYEELLSRYPTFDNRLSVYYKLYTIGKQTENIAMVSKYQQKITNEYPNSNYALVLSDPDYFKKIEAQERQEDKQYEQIYTSFERSQYAQTTALINKAIEKNSESKYMMQYEYMLTISEGVQKDTVAFITDLERLISKYPDGDIAERSRMIITYLKTENPEAAKQQEIKQAVALYSLRPSAEHFVVVALPRSRNVNQLMFNIINFNIDNFAELDLKVQKADVGSNTLMQITSFKDQAEAEQYFGQLMGHADLYRDVDATGAKIFYISKTNLSVLKRDKKLEQYLTFFEQNMR